MAGAAAQAGAGTAVPSGTAGAGPGGRATPREGWRRGHEAGVRAPVSIRYQVPRGKGRGQLLRTPDL